MTRALLCAALLVGILLAACSDDKGSSGSSSSSGDTSSKSEDKKKDKEDEKEEGKDEAKEKKPDTDEKTDEKETNVDPGKTDQPEPTAERGFKDSKQPEGDSLDGTEIVPEMQYKAGERLKVSVLGFSYVVPEGAVSAIGTGGFAIQVVVPGSDMLTLIVARTGVTEAEARDMISQPYDVGNGVKLTPQGEIVKNGDRLSRAMSAPTITGYAQMLIGKSTGVAVMSIGLAGKESECKTASGKVADTIKFAAPAGEKQRLEHEAGLKGKVAHVFKYKGDSTYGSSWSSETNKHWHFGSDHTYEFIYKHTGSSSFESGGYAADTDNNHAGTWSIELTLSLPALVLRTSDGRIITHTLNVVNGRLHVDGDEASLNASNRKR